MSPDDENDTQRTKPWPGYFIVRTTGEVVPLIAVDELPPGTDLLGIPRSLDLDATIGMLNLGLQESSGSFYQICGSGEKETEIAVVNSKSKALQLSTPPASQSALGPHQPSPSQVLGTDNRTDIAPPPSPNFSQPRPTHPRSELQICRHWCTHGICKWGQQCHFRHMMPMTLSGLRAVGLSDWPSWFRALNPGSFANSSEKRRARAAACSGGSCCAAAASKAVLVQNGVQRLRGAAPLDAGAGMSDREKTRKDGETSEQQTLIKLRSMQQEGVGKIGSGKKDHASKNIMLERAAVKDAKHWEDERASEVDLDAVGKRGGAVREKLVDV